MDPVGGNQFARWQHVEASWRAASEFFQAKYDRAHSDRNRLEMLDADLGLCYLFTHGRPSWEWTDAREITAFGFCADGYRVPGGPFVRAERSMRLGGKGFEYAEVRFRTIAEILETQFGEDLPVIPPIEAWGLIQPYLADCVPKRFRGDVIV